MPPGVLSESDEYVWSAVATDGVTSSSQASLASYETEPGPDQAEVVFVEAMQVEDAILWAEGHGVRPVDLNASYAMSDETIQLSYRVPDLDNALSSSAAAIASDYSQITLEGTESLVEELTADDETSQDQILLAGWVAGSLAGGDIPVESILVAGTTGALADLAFDASVSSVVIRSQGASEESETEAEDDPVMCDGSDETPEHAPRPWGAYSGRITTTRLYDANGSPTGRRSIYQSMKWNNTRIKRMKCHIPIIIFGQQTGTAQYAHTYEADAKFTLRNGTYLGGKRVYYSNMPKKRYLDNRWLEDDRSWTVGTTNMKKMKANKLYWTYIVTKAGTAPKDRGHIYGDIGRKSFCPPGGAWAFCISSWDTYYIIFPNKYRAPSTVKWSQ